MEYFFKFIYFERERKRERAGKGQGGKREREAQAGSALSPQSPICGSNSRTVRSWPEPKPRVGHLTNWATQVPLEYVSSLGSTMFFWKEMLLCIKNHFKLSPAWFHWEHLLYGFYYSSFLKIFQYAMFTPRLLGFLPFPFNWRAQFSQFLKYINLTI